MMANFDPRTVKIGDYAPEGAFADASPHLDRIEIPYWNAPEAPWIHPGG